MLATWDIDSMERSRETLAKKVHKSTQSEKNYVYIGICPCKLTGSFDSVIMIERTTRICFPYLNKTPALGDIG